MEDNYWNNRSTTYDNLEWHHMEDRIDPLLHTLGSLDSHTVIDLGCGTGSTTVLLPSDNIIGIDRSRSMIDIASNNYPHLKWVIGDARNIPIVDDSTNVVLLRMVIHHITDGLQCIMDEACRVLVGNGNVVISEAIPPTIQSLGWWNDMFSLKEERVTYLPHDILSSMWNAGIHCVKVNRYKSRNFSIRNWLDNNNLDKYIYDMIFDMHCNMNDALMDAFNLRFVDDDILIDSTYVIIVGEVNV